MPGTRHARATGLTTTRHLFAFDCNGLFPFFRQAMYGERRKSSNPLRDRESEGVQPEDQSTSVEFRIGRDQHLFTTGGPVVGKGGYIMTIEAVSKVARQGVEFNFGHPTFCAGTIGRFGVESLGCTTSRSSTTPSGKRSARSCRQRPTLADHAPTTGWSWKGFSGSCAAGRAGVICQSDIPRPAPVGDDCAIGKKKRSGSISGGCSSPNWPPKGGSTGTKYSWTGASPRPKKGALRG